MKVGDQLVKMQLSSPPDQISSKMMVVVAAAIMDCVETAVEG